MDGLPSPTPAAVAALAPGDTLRAGINLSNNLLISDRTDTGDPAGVSPDMAAALARQLGVDLELVTFANPGELADAAVDDAWDIGNIGADPLRAEFISFSAPYCQIESTYLVGGDSPITSIAEVDSAGVRIATKARAAYTLWLERNLRHAEMVQTSDVEESFARFVAGDADVLAGLRPRLLEDLERLSGCRLLPGRFASVQQAIGTPRNRPSAGVQYLDEFVASALSTGFVADLISRHGVEGRLGPAD